MVGPCNENTHRNRRTNVNRLNKTCKGDSSLPRHMVNDRRRRIPDGWPVGRGQLVHENYAGGTYVGSVEHMAPLVVVTPVCRVQQRRLLFEQVGSVPLVESGQPGHQS